MIPGRNGKLDRSKVVAIVFIFAIFLGGILTAAFGARNIGSNMLANYRGGLENNTPTMDQVKRLIYDAESGVTTEFFFEEELINIHGTASNVLDQRIVEDASEIYTVYKLDNGQLSFSYPEFDVSNKIENTIKLNSSLKDMGIPLIYVQAPFKLNKYDNQLPYDHKDYTNKTVDNYLKGIEEAGVKNFDLREVIKKNNMDYSNLYFNTDHHWKPETGLWASGVIAELLEKDYRFKIDESVFDLVNYDKKNYEKWFLGSQGKRVGVGYGGVDDISLLTPKFDTSFEFYIPSKELTRTGNFKDTMLFMEHIEQKDYFNLNPYAAYIGGDHPLDIIKNLNSPNDERILLVHDSYSLVVIPFLSMAAEELYAVDLRYFSSMSLAQYAETIKPSVVIVLYNPSMFTDEKPFMFQ